MNAYADTDIPGMPEEEAEEPITGRLPRSLDRDNWHIPKKEGHDERVFKKDFSVGEQSPYWDNLEWNGGPSSDASSTGDFSLVEDSTSNPDVLSEGDTVARWMGQIQDKSLEQATASDWAKYTLNPTEYMLWRLTQRHPMESWKVLGRRMKKTEKQVEYLLKSIRKKWLEKGEGVK